MSTLKLKNCWVYARVSNRSVTQIMGRGRRDRESKSLKDYYLLIGKK
jgi:hypothetical protein